MKPFQSLRILWGLSLAVATSGIAPLHAQDKVALYDNLTELIGFQGRSLFPTADLKGLVAQPFKTGEHGNIASVAMPLALLGSPTGILPIEIWNDVEGEPGTKVAAVGEVDLETIAPVEDGGEIVRFEDLDIQLETNTTYHLVVDETNTNVTDINKSYLFQTTPGNQDTNSAGKMLGQKDGSWIIVGDSPMAANRNYRTMEILECPPPVEAGKALYDNVARFLPREGDGVFSATDLKAVLAQPFTTGEFGTICSVAFPVERFGSPNGIVPVEIWDDDGGKPGQRVATVGEFDISELALRQDGGEILRFETEITGLTPRTTYYLLTDDTDADVTGGSKTYGVPTVPDDQDTGISGRLLGSSDGGESWVFVGDVQADRNYRIMEILECPPVSSEVILYDNIPEQLPPFTRGSNNAGPPGPAELQPIHAQPFLTDASGTVSSVDIYIIGTTGVSGSLDVVITKDGGGFPGDTIATVGTIDLESLTLWESETTGNLLTFTKEITGLEPNTRYYIGFDITKMAPINGRFPDASFFNYVVADDEGSRGAGVIMVGPFGEWKPLSDFVPDANYMLMRVRASVPMLVPLPIPPIENGTVQVEPALDEHPVGSNVSVTADPAEGFEFVKWTYGEEEFLTNPATITIIEGATLTPIFAEIEESKPLQVDIEQAVAISWDSQTDKTYQIHSSNDMETWEIAMDGIEGTGERLTQCFVRGETEVFYRVEEAP